MRNWTGLFVTLFLALFVIRPAAGAEKRYLFIIVDGTLSQSVVAALKANPSLRLTVAFDGNVRIPDEAKPLVPRRRIDPAFVVADEPALPLVYDLNVSAPLEVEFSWPDDVRELIVRARQEAAPGLPSAPAGLLIRSGLFSRRLAPELRSLGVRWAVVEGSAPGGVLRYDGFPVLVATRETPKSEDECKTLLAASGPYTVWLFGAKNRLTAETLGWIRRSVEADLEAPVAVVTPEQVYRELAEGSPEGGDSLEPDLQYWTRSPIVWYELDSAREAIEEYKNSGQAKPQTFLKLKDEIFRLYSADLLARLQEKSDPDVERAFQEGLNGIYRLLSASPVEKGAAAPSPGAAGTYQVETTTGTLAVTNAPSAGLPGISRFDITLGDGNILYAVDLDTGAAADAIDLYMDLNNQEGAGSNRFLSGTYAFMDVNDAWEYAVRVEGNTASVYRFGRIEPLLVGRYPAVEGRFEIPRTVLRGNPLRWGYQAVLLRKTENGQQYAVADFLARDTDERSRLLGASPVQLPAVRAINRPR